MEKLGLYQKGSRHDQERRFSLEPTEENVRKNIFP